MSTLVVLGLLIGLDNLRFGIGLGALNLDVRRRWQLALSFGLFEGLMPLVGVLMGRSLAGVLEVYAASLGPVLVALCGVLVLWGAARGVDARNFLSKSWWIFVLPLTLSIDNMLAGGAVAAMNLPLALALPTIGLLSAALSLLGLYGGAAILRYSPVRSDFITGGALILVAIVGFIPFP